MRIEPKLNQELLRNCDWLDLGISPWKRVVKLRLLVLKYPLDEKVLAWQFGLGVCLILSHKFDPLSTPLEFKTSSSTSLVRLTLKSYNATVRLQAYHLTPYTFFFHVIKVDGSSFSGYIIKHFSDHPCFSIDVSMVGTYKIIIMSFIATNVVYISIVKVICAFISSYTLSLLPTVLPWVSWIIL